MKALQLDTGPIILGGWTIGGWYWGRTSRTESLRVVAAALESGIRAIDTAPIYGFGRSEEIIGEALQGSRDRVLLLSKCGLNWQSDYGKHFFDEAEFAGKAYRVFRNLSSESIIAECEASLRRLKTDYIDLYQIHWLDHTTPTDETMQALLGLQNQGKIRFVGACNVGVEELLAWRRDYPELNFIADQERFNLLERKALKGNIPYCRKNRLQFLAYSPLAQGLLTGKFSPEHSFASGDYRSDKKLLSAENRQRMAVASLELSNLCEKYSCTLANLAVAWLLSIDGVTAAICGARTPEQIMENARAGEIKLTAEDADFVSEVLSGF